MRARTFSSSPRMHSVLVPPPSMPMKYAKDSSLERKLTRFFPAGKRILPEIQRSGHRQIGYAEHEKLETGNRTLYIADRRSDIPQSGGLNTADLAIILAYLAGITIFGLRFRKKQRSLKDYFLADRDIPWWAIMLSIVAAETSVLTIISTPGLLYNGNMTFLQVVLGYLVGRVVISVLMLPHYFKGDLFTAYQLMERRFG